MTVIDKIDLTTLQTEDREREKLEGTICKKNIYQFNE